MIDRQLLSYISFLILSFSAHAGFAAGSCQSLFDVSIDSIFGQNQEAADQFFHLEYEPTKVMHVKKGSNPKKVDPEFQSKRTDRMNVDLVMKEFKISKLQAVEVQALLRRFVKHPRLSDIQTAVAAVKAGRTLSRLNVAKVSKAKFVLVLDIDGTLLDQDANFYLDGSHVSSFLVDGSKMHHVAVNPGALKTIRRAQELGGSVVLFSRNNDRLIWEVLSSTNIGQGLRLVDLVDGVFTSSHMSIASEVAERVGTEDMMGLLKKDLGIIPNKRVLLIDDDAKYVLQQNALIEVPKFDLEDFYRQARRHLKTERSDSSNTRDRNDDIFDYSRSAPKSPEMSEAEKQAIVSEIQSFKAIYETVTQKMEFLVANAKQFSELQAVFSPRGELAIELLTDQHEKYFVPKVRPVSSDQALQLLIDDPKLIEETIKNKKRRPEPEPSFNGFNMFKDIPRLFGR